MFTLNFRLIFMGAKKWRLLLLLLLPSGFFAGFLLQGLLLGSGNLCHLSCSEDLFLDVCIGQTKNET